MIFYDDWKEVGELLQDYYSLFYAFWKIGTPILDDTINTAAVSFDHRGEYLNFHFNEKFWNSSSLYERAFITAHECLHVLLSHGLRAKNAKVPEASNVAMDVVVNHMLIEQYGFSRDKIHFQKELCWIDTVFSKEKQATVLKYQNFEYYYNLLEIITIDFETLMVLDEHKSFIGKDFSKAVEKAAGSMGSAEIADALESRKADKGLNGNVDDFKKEEELDKTIDKLAGTGSGGWSRYSTGVVKKKNTWEGLFKKFFKKWSEKPQESWARTSRRLHCLPEDIIIPSEFEDEEKKNELIPVWLFLDISGSCYHYKDRFMKAYESIPKEKFVVKLFSFDTRVHPVDKIHGRIYGGGGTSFGPIENYIQSEISNKNAAYPKIVMVFTDGYGTYVHPEKAERWYWFLDKYGSSDYLIPAKSHKLYLNDFE